MGTVIRSDPRRRLTALSVCALLGADFTATRTSVPVAGATSAVITITPSRGLPDAPVTVAGSGFPRRAAVMVTDTTTQVPICTTRTTVHGRFVCVGRMQAAPGGFEHISAATAGAKAVATTDFRAFGTGIIGTIAGGGEGDHGPATAAMLYGPSGVTADRAGNVFIADARGHRIRKVSTNGVITTVAGTGDAGFSGDGGPATDATLARPYGVALDRADNLYISDGNRIRRINPAGIITTVAGTGDSGFSGDGGKATDAMLNGPTAITVDGVGNVYIADTDNQRARKVNPAGVITTVAGTGELGYSGDGGRATKARLDRPRGVAVDLAGHLYIADTGNNRVRKVGTNGLITTIAGTGEVGSSGDGGPASGATVSDPISITVDRAGNVYVSSWDRVRKVDVSGTISTVAGGASGVPIDVGYPGDGGLAVNATLYDARGVATDRAGNLYIADTGNYRVRKVDVAGIVTTIAGNGTSSGDGLRATNATLALPSGIAVDETGNVYLADRRNNRVRMIDRAGVITTIAGNARPASGDGGPATGTTLVRPSGVAVDTTGNVYLIDPVVHRVRRVDPSGIITTVAGGGAGGLGEGGRATDATLTSVAAVTVDRTGNLYIADEVSNRIRKVDTAGIITTIAGTGTAGYAGDGRPAVEANLNVPGGLAVDAAGNLYVADKENFRIRKVDTAGTITTIAGNGTPGSAGAGDGGLATDANLEEVTGIAVDTAGNVYLGSNWSPRVRKVDAAGIISTIAGNGTASSTGDGGPATAATLSGVMGLAADNLGNVYIAELQNRIRRVDSRGIITTVAGHGLPGFTGDGGPATDATLGFPQGVAADTAGSIYIADTANNRIRKVDGAGIITTIAGGATQLGDGGPATDAALSWPDSVAVDSAGNVYIADTANNRIRKVDAAGIITTIAGNGAQGFSGDGGPATDATLGSPYGVAVDTVGNVYIADTGNFRVRKIDTAGIITTIAGSGAFGSSGDGGPGTAAMLTWVSGVAVDAHGNLFIADEWDARVRKVDTAGIITTIAGTGRYGFNGDGGPATEATLSWPAGVAVDRVGNVYIADHSRIRKVDTAGMITTIAGTETWGHDGDGIPAVKAGLEYTAGVAVGPTGNVYVAEADDPDDGCDCHYFGWIREVVGAAGVRS